MRDYILSAPDEATLQAALPDYYDSEAGAWTGAVIAGATIWIERPTPGDDETPGDPGQKQDGYHLILRANSLPETAAPYLVTEPVDIEPVFAGGLKLGDTRTPAVPRSISAVQFRITAAAHGILGTIEAIIADEQTPQAVKIAWEYAREFERASPTIEALRQHPSINLTAEEVDDLFREAADIKV